jgi:transcriptional regulator with XRE-family HTH domain
VRLYDLFYGMSIKGNRKAAQELPEHIIRQLGARIKQLRLKAGYANYELFAYDHNFSRSQFGRYELGENITFVTLIRIAGAFNMSLQEFFSEGFD